MEENISCVIGNFYLKLRYILGLILHANKISRYFRDGSLHSGSRSCDKSDPSKMSSVIQELSVPMNW